MTPGEEAVNSTVAIEDVKAVVVETLNIADRADSLEPSSPLLGSLPELDSMAVLEVVYALEQRFDVEFDGEDISAEAFETLSSLTDMVAAQLS
jgi:acyl carrier protein